jgi:protein associated with RNAse G/E
MKIGDEIRFSACKADGFVYRSWQTIIESMDTDCIITISPAGSMVIDRTKLGDHPITNHLRSYYWHNRFYNLIEVFDVKSSELIEIYINIAAPPELTDDGMSFKDYELDVVRDLPGTAKLVDEDEFVEAIPIYHYSREFQEKMYAAASEAMKLADEWQARPCPVFGENND